MYNIVKKEALNPTVTKMVIHAPSVAAKVQAGQFIILRTHEDGERIPLTVADYDRDGGTVTIIFQIVGATTQRLNALNEGDSLCDFVGPLGRPTETEGRKKVAVIGGGVGCAIAYPVAKKFYESGTVVHSVVGFRSKDLVILENEFRAVSHEFRLMSDDGSAGEKGLVTDALRALIESGEKYDEVIAIGPVVMMKFVSLLTKEYGIKTTVSMNPIMIDGTGMCGGCRLTVGGQVKFACVDGPDFDGHQVDFDEAMKRGAMYREVERSSHEHVCNLLKKADEASKVSQKQNEMPSLSPEERVRSFDEVALGYTEEQAVSEAKRCLNCKHKPCVDGCPVKIHIPQFIAKVAEGDFEEAYQVISRASSLPAVCGRVCPQENQCEAKCVRGIKGESVAIGRLERFVADWHMKNSDGAVEIPEKNGHKVAVIGSGPAGLACAGELAKGGFDVTVFEALHTPGGVLVYGIPEFRLPKSIVQKEIDSLRELGVEIRCNTVIGKTFSVDDLEAEGYEAIFIGSGAGLPKFMNIPGETLPGVVSANEFLTRVNLMKAYREGSDTPIRRSDDVVVVGGGNVAMDAARCALRLGAERVSVVYRRGEEELPARREEVLHAKEEGILFRLLSAPVEILSGEDGNVSGVRCIEMELGEPDESGRRRPVEKPGSEFVIPAQTVIMAIGTSPNPLIKSTTEGLDTLKWGGIIADENGLTTRARVYAGGDAVTGAATVILAMGAGKNAARAIAEELL